MAIDLDRLREWLSLVVIVAGIAITSCFLIAETFFGYAVHWHQYMISSLMTGLPVEKILSAVKKKG